MGAFVTCTDTAINAQWRAWFYNLGPGSERQGEPYALSVPVIAEYPARVAAFRGALVDALGYNSL